MAEKMAEQIAEILKEPKNAILKQYQKLFDFDNIQLELTDDALTAVATEAIARKTGARGLRSILEGVLLNTMYELPGMENVAKVVIDESLLRYIAQIVQQTRSTRAVYLGASPRASVAMLQASKAYALLQGRDFVTPEDIKQVTPSILQHRLVLTAEAEMEGYTAYKVAQRLIDKVEVPK